MSCPHCGGTLTREAKDWYCYQCESPWQDAEIRRRENRANLWLTAAAAMSVVVTTGIVWFTAAGGFAG